VHRQASCWIAICPKTKNQKQNQKQKGVCVHRQASCWIAICPKTKNQKQNQKQKGVCVHRQASSWIAIWSIATLWWLTRVRGSLLLQVLGVLLQVLGVLLQVLGVLLQVLGVCAPSHICPLCVFVRGLLLLQGGRTHVHMDVGGPGLRVHPCESNLTLTQGGKHVNTHTHTQLLLGAPARAGDGLREGERAFA
jgi:hypothetical protein